MCPRGRETVCQAPYGTVSPPGVEAPCSCAFLVKHRPGRAKNSLPWDQSRPGMVRASFLPPRRASQHSSSQAAWEGSILGWGGVTGILGFLSCQPGPPSSPSSLHSLCQSSPQNPLLLLRKPRQMPSPAKQKSDPACEVAWSVPGSLSSHFAPPCPPPPLPPHSL